MKVSADLRRRLDAIDTPKSKLTQAVRKPKARWVEPTLIAEVEYRDITAEGYLRHSLQRTDEDGRAVCRRPRSRARALAV